MPAAAAGRRNAARQSASRDATRALTVLTNALHKFRVWADEMSLFDPPATMYRVDVVFARPVRAYFYLYETNRFIHGGPARRLSIRLTPVSVFVNAFLLAAQGHKEEAKWLLDTAERAIQDEGQYDTAVFRLARLLIEKHELARGAPNATGERPAERVCFIVVQGNSSYMLCPSLSLDPQSLDYTVSGCDQPKSARGYPRICDTLSDLKCDARLPPPDKRFTDEEWIRLHYREGVCRGSERMAVRMYRRLVSDVVRIAPLVAGYLRALMRLRTVINP